jgi:predicted enzyme related to lactoylglutathione lyase
MLRSDMAERTIGLVLDCADPERLAQFWADALEGERIGAAGNYVLVKGPAGQALLLQHVPEPKTGKNRMHFDVHVPDVEGEATRLQGLGASRLTGDVQEEFDSRWIVMADPEGNEFCVCSGEL